jgi:hypothetical protein
MHTPSMPSPRVWRRRRRAAREEAERVGNAAPSLRGVGTFHGNGATGIQRNLEFLGKGGNGRFSHFAQIRFSTSRPSDPLEFCQRRCDLGEAGLSAMVADKP